MSRHIGPGKEALRAACGILTILALVMSTGAQDGKAKKDMGLKPAAVKDTGLKPAAAIDRDEVPAAAAAADRDAGGRKTMIRMGYTRPGNPSDDVDAEGGIKPVAFEQLQGRIIGGTVYFAVFDRLGGRDKQDGPAAEAAAVGDAWSTGLGDLPGRFVPGKSKAISGARSPRLDTRARYLYLYQVVNDRGTVIPKKGGGVVVPAAAEDEQKSAKIQDVASFTLKLMVDPRFITSWGHFRGAGFAANVSDKKVKGGGGIAPVAFDDEDVGKDIRLAVSADPGIQTSLPVQRYVRNSPAYDLGKIKRGYSLADATIGMKGTSTHQKLEKDRGDGIKLASWAENYLTAANLPREPEYVQVKYFPTAPGLAAGQDPVNAIEGRGATDDEPAPAIFRVDWQQGQYLGEGFQSVAFGFTSDLPPIDLPIRLDDPQAARTSEGIRTVASEDPAPGQAPGISPSPRIALAAANVAGETGATSAGGGMSTMGGMPGGFGGGGLGGLGGGGSLGGGGALGGAGTPLIGGGSGGGTGSGTPSTAASTTPTTNTTPTNANNNRAVPSATATTPPVVVNSQPMINFNSSIANQQSQAQAQLQAQGQLQAQRQNQSQSQSSSSGSAVVPEPASLVLGALGLPGLFFLRRRKPAAENAA
jgi:hypothetical protein